MALADESTARRGKIRSGTLAAAQVGVLVVLLLPSRHLDGRPLGTR